MTSEDLDILLDLHSTPLEELSQDDNWWQLGPIGISKKHTTFTAGFGHPIKVGTKFDVHWFELGNRRGWAIVLTSGGTPPEYFVGWLPPADEAKARRWVATLNSEIQGRLAKEHGTPPGAVHQIDQLTFEQGNEFAPDAPWGYQRVTLSSDGQLEYEQRDRGKHRVIKGRVNPERVRALHAYLRQTSFPSPPQSTFLPGASLIVLTVEPQKQRMLIDYFTGLKLDGYRELIRELGGLNDALRESIPESLEKWSFVA